MKQSIWRRRVPRALAHSVLVVVAAAGLGGGYLMLNPTYRVAVGPGRVVLPAGSYPTFPLVLGVMAPAFEAAGWVNGSPPAGERPRLIVLDIWASW